jgi:PAS domain S-box-containing protein
MTQKKHTAVRSPEELAAIQAILEGTATTIGERFFATLVENLAKALGTYGAWVTVYLEETQRLRALAFWLGGKWVQDYEYDIKGTPCEPVIRDLRCFHVPDKVIELFPDDPDLKPIDAVSYMGVPLIDLDGKILGHLAVLDQRPMPEERRELALFQIFAARATAEHQRLRAEQEIRDREEKLNRLVDSAMDAIVELDHEFRITQMNSAGNKLFHSDARDIIGQQFSQFLQNKDQSKLSNLIKELNERPMGRQYMWIPGGLACVLKTGTPFPAEATLSRFEMNRRTYYTLIIRNVNERLEAEKKIYSLTVEAKYLREEINELQNAGEIIGESKPLLDVLQEVKEVAETDTTVLIYGETGTGKELIARAVHNASKRNKKPFIKVNCAAIPVNLVESEFFGHEKGAFTGATSKRDGRFTLADGGTIFLDEIGELPIDLQSKLLRVLQEGEFDPVGGSQTKKVNVRVIAATNRNLQELVQEGQFREDLYYRLSVFPIEVPSLRERGEDIVLLASTFVKRVSKNMGRKIEPLPERTIQRLLAYNWPGNIRELQNVIERAIITS